MKLIEAMKKLRVIEKRMADNSHKIEEYSAFVSTERLPFETEEAQKKELRSRIQANTDLMTEYLGLKRAIERTNLAVQVEIGGTSYTISDLLTLKRRLGALMMETYLSLNTGQADRRVSRMATLEGTVPQVVRLYKEDEKNENLRKWQDLLDNIDSRLEVVNATTDIVEE